MKALYQFISPLRNRHGAGLSSRPAFTMVEILTTVAIMTILMALVIVGLRNLNRNARNQATKNALERCRSMINEFETQNAGVGGIAALNAAFSGSNGVTGATVAAPTAQVDGNNAVFQNTNAVMMQMATLPSIAQMISRMPSGSFFPGTRIPIDGWGNPILLVPGGGLTGVTIGGQSNQTVYSPDSAGGARPGRPFFASAGEDGVFSKGDDNIYSYLTP